LSLVYTPCMVSKKKHLHRLFSYELYSWSPQHIKQKVQDVHLYRYWSLEALARNGTKHDVHKRAEKPEEFFFNSQSANSPITCTKSSILISIQERCEKKNFS